MFCLMKKLFFASLTMIFACTLPVLAQQTSSLDSAVASASAFENIPRVAVPARPFLFINNKEIATARERAENEEWAKKLKANYLRTADEWVERDYAFVQNIIPPTGSLFIYGLGLNLDPVQKKRMTWRGWKDPRRVQGSDGAIYPSASHSDDGSGWMDPKTKEKYFFIAFANGMTITQLERTDLPALVNAYALTGKEVYAQRALWILDAIATIYPRAYEGPIDYPGNKPGRPDGGRLERPYYQAARALVRYAYFAEVLSSSVHATEPSPSNAPYSMLKNIELNLLMNGADYCLRMTKSGKGASLELNNGNIDYNRGPLVVGAMLGIPEWVEWALNGPLGFRYAVTNTIDINGRYFETGASYAQHTRELLLSTAQVLTRMRMPAYPQGFPAYDDKRFALFALDFFTGIQAAGRLPLFGDAGPDRAVLTHGRPFDKGTLLAAQEFYHYSQQNDVREAALRAGAQMLQNLPENYQPGEAELFHAPDWNAQIKQIQAGSSHNKGSTLFFDYGTLIFRSGPADNERAAVIRFGPTLNHGQADELNLQFYAKGREFSFDPGYYNTHLRFGFTSSTVAHNLLVVNRRNQLRRPAPGGDLQTWTDGSILRSAAVDNPQAYADQDMQEYKRRVALIDISPDDSYIIDTFWARGGRDYDYSLHGISQGKLEILPSPGTALQETRTGSILSPQVDYSAEMDANGRVASYANSQFYFAPPGDGYGFLSRPSFYALNGPARLQWSASDKTDHQLYVSHFAPPAAQLITAQSPKPPGVMDVTYALSRVNVAASQTVRFTSVILPTQGANKLASIEELTAGDKPRETFALRLKPAAEVISPVREHLYFASNKSARRVSFENDISFSGEEGYLSLDGEGKVLAASLTGSGEIRKGQFKFSVATRFTKPLQILKIENQPLRLLVNAPYDQTRHLAGSIVRLNKAGLSRPFSLRVQKIEAAGQDSWLTMDASSNIHAVGIVKSYDAASHTLTTDAPFPRARPYLFGYDFETGESGISNSQNEYNGTYDGFQVVKADNPQQNAGIKTLQNKRTEIVLDTGGTFSPGDAFEIQLFASGDTLEIPVWSQAQRNTNGQWQFSGNGEVTLNE